MGVDDVGNTYFQFASAGGNDVLVRRVLGSCLEADWWIVRTAMVEFGVWLYWCRYMELTG
jgi:hypothetical protein